MFYSFSLYWPTDLHYYFVLNLVFADNYEPIPRFPFFGRDLYRLLSPTFLLVRSVSHSLYDDNFRPTSERLRLLLLLLP